MLLFFCELGSLSTSSFTSLYAWLTIVRGLASRSVSLTFVIHRCLRLGIWLCWNLAVSLGVVLWINIAVSAAFGLANPVLGSQL